MNKDELMEAIKLEHDILEAIQDMMIDEPSRMGSDSIGGCLRFKSVYLTDYRVGVRKGYLVIDRFPHSETVWEMSKFSLADPNCFDNLVKTLTSYKEIENGTSRNPRRSRNQ
jgi:hypothetical protein